MVDWEVPFPSKRTLWTAFAISMLCALFVIERQAGLNSSSQEPTELYAPEKFGSESDDRDYEGPYIWDAGSKMVPSGDSLLGATYEGNLRELEMPPSHDVFGKLQDQRAEYDNSGALPDEFVRDLTPSTAMLSMLTSKKTDRPQVRLKQASPSAPEHPTLHQFALFDVATATVWPFWIPA
jgi:hypothetical protein